MSTSNTAAQSIAIALCNRRVLALEQQCRVLAAEVDAMRGVVEAAVRAVHANGLMPWSLIDAVTTYEAAKEQ